MLCRILKSLKRPPHIEVATAPPGLWHWRIRAANGEIQAASEVYDSKSNAQRGAQRIADLTGWEIKET